MCVNTLYIYEYMCVDDANFKQGVLFQFVYSNIYIYLYV